jgi:hypothetical protein
LNIIHYSRQWWHYFHYQTDPIIKSIPIKHIGQTAQNLLIKTAIDNVGVLIGNPVWFVIILQQYKVDNPPTRLRE